jgi:5-methylcytosine-specific restriction endonuclease McrA
LGSGIAGCKKIMESKGKWQEANERQMDTQTYKHDAKLEPQGIRSIAEIVGNRLGIHRVRVVSDHQLLVLSLADVDHQIYINSRGDISWRKNGEGNAVRESIDAIVQAIEEIGPIESEDNGASRKVNVASLMKMLESQMFRCALSGRELTTSNTTLDHINPYSQSDDHSIDNVHLVVDVINRAKGTMSTGDFIRMCHDVVNTHPYTHPPVSEGTSFDRHST